jgi:hypothetical protein
MAKKSAKIAGGEGRRSRKNTKAEIQTRTAGREATTKKINTNNQPKS